MDFSVSLKGHLLLCPFSSRLSQSLRESLILFNFFLYSSFYHFSLLSSLPLPLGGLTKEQRANARKTVITGKIVLSNSQRASAGESLAMKKQVSEKDWLGCVGVCDKSGVYVCVLGIECHSSLHFLLVESSESLSYV